MDDEINGLRALVLKENHSAYYVHCFSYELQLVVVEIAQKDMSVRRFFEMVGTLASIVCASCEPQDMLRESQKEKLEKVIGHLAIDKEIGLNQEVSLAKAGDTHSNSHYNALTHLVSSYSSVIEVLEYIEKTGNTIASRNKASNLLMDLNTFDFVFYLHLMMRILEITSTLSQCLQRKDEDLLNAVLLVNSTKLQLQNFRQKGFDSFFEDVNSFGDQHEIEEVKMNDNYVNPKRPRQRTNITYRQHYEFDCFNKVLDMQIQEFENRFNDVSSELLACMGSLSPCDNFREFNIPKILRLAEMYPYDFDEDDKRRLEFELPIYVDNLKADQRFAKLNGVSTLVRLMVETKKHLSFTLVYRLLKLSLVLPVATASVERCFTSMKCVKSDLHNRLGDEYSSERCICYIENELLMNVNDEDVVDLLESMTNP
ncbi:uncharacterized protein LOC143559113 [Bidens hawaiensis]|uniref:uncharacterized protein LOC143559113 n=1 Tax=Bidens hawaiensis TaxID=980011 RepID=UPI00404B23AA